MKGGARSYWKPLVTMEEGPDGTVVRKRTRKLHYVCDLGPTAGKMTQLSFIKTTLKNTPGNDDTQQGELSNNSLTCTEGQNVGFGDVQTVDDEN